MFGVRQTGGSSTWVIQQARNVACNHVNEDIHVKFLIRDRDTKYMAGFDEVFRSEGAQILRTPFRTPNANAHAERFVSAWAWIEKFLLSKPTGDSEVRAEVGA
jgi:hypothetical protein